MMTTALLRQVNAGSQTHVAHAGAPRRATPSGERPPLAITMACWELYHVPQDISINRHNTTETIQNILKLFTDPNTGTDNWT